jgi:hypothetical protein
MEKVLGKSAIVDRADLGASYKIDTSEIAQIVRDLVLRFDDRYLERVINKYYGRERRG